MKDLVKIDITPLYVTNAGIGDDIWYLFDRFLDIEAALHNGLTQSLRPV